MFTAPAPKATMPSWSSKPSFLAACEANGESGGASTACGTKFHCYAGRHVDLRRLEARDDLGALVWQAGEGARVHRRLRQRCRGVAGSLYEEHLWSLWSLIANLALSEARRELQFFLQLVLYDSVTPQTAVWLRRSMRLHKKPQEHDCVSQKNRAASGSSEARDGASQPSRCVFESCQRARTLWPDYDKTRVDDVTSRPNRPCDRINRLHRL